MTASPLTPDEQFQALNLLDYLSDLFAASPNESFTRVQILIVLDNLRSDPDFFDPEVLIAQQIATAEINSHPA
jgi:hypothetical protein